MAATLEHTYAYPFASKVDAGRWSFASSRNTATFFHGELSRPDAVARMLQALSQIVRTHFFDARPPQMDPIATSSPKRLRWEGFSGCCGAYARIDLDAGAFLDAEQTFGTTNVDFNSPMIAHLAQIHRTSDTTLSISSEQVAIQSGESKVVEKKVKLPQRWIKGLSEVQSYQARLKQLHSIQPAVFSRLLHSLSSNSNAPFLVLRGASIRLSPRESPGCVPVGGAERLKPLAPLLPLANAVGIWSDQDSGASAFSLETEVGRFWLVLSPALHRGFSGEGQVLTALTNERSRDVADRLYDHLGWQDELHPAELAAQLGCSAADAADALAVLSTEGLAGFDAATGYFFHRELPFDVAAVEHDQPRLRGARKLLAQNAVKVLRSHEDQHDVEVVGSSAAQFVKLRPDGDQCSCAWHSRHQGKRGPCKHILAARMLVTGDRR